MINENILLTDVDLSSQAIELLQNIKITTIGELIHAPAIIIMRELRGNSDLYLEIVDLTKKHLALE